MKYKLLALFVIVTQLVAIPSYSQISINSLILKFDSTSIITVTKTYHRNDMSIDTTTGLLNKEYSIVPTHFTYLGDSIVLSWGNTATGGYTSADYYDTTEVHLHYDSTHNKIEDFTFYQEHSEYGVVGQITIITIKNVILKAESGAFIATIDSDKIGSDDFSWRSFGGHSGPGEDIQFDSKLNVAFASAAHLIITGSVPLKTPIIYTPQKLFPFFPNPTQGEITLQVEEDLPDVRIYSFMGSCVERFVPYQNQRTFNTSLPSGEYFLAISNQLQKLIIER
ncbi:MAG TPA: T9SS type A sorting domain-containing protein [Candidatus Kapabacteria bacterium]|nr:T9SS type A sorting domain-containing protein [Candidatus Kapabacteria bacterium]